MLTVPRAELREPDADVAHRVQRGEVILRLGATIPGHIVTALALRLLARQQLLVQGLLYGEGFRGPVDGFLKFAQRRKLYAEVAQALRDLGMHLSKRGTPFGQRLGYTCPLTSLAG